MSSLEVNGLFKKKVENGKGAEDSEDVMELSEKHNVTEDLERQFWFWARQLVNFVDENSVVFAVHEKNTFCKIPLIEVVKTLKEVDYFEDVVSINYLPHPFFLKITFKTSSMVEIFVDTVESIDGKRIRILDNKSMPQVCTIMINNLPPELIEQCVLPQLIEFGEMIKLVQQYIPRNDGGRVQIGQSKIVFKMNEGCGIQNIPFFVKVYGFKVFLYIRGRQKVCFRCGSGEHLVSKCHLKFCGFCRNLKPVRHPCMASYAAVVASTEPDAVVLAMQDQLLEQIDGMDVVGVGDEGGVKEGDLSDGGSEISIGDEGRSGGEVILLEPNVTVKEDRARAVVLSSKRMRTRSLSIGARRKSYKDNVEKNALPAKPKQKDVKKRKKKEKNGDDLESFKNEKEKKKKNDEESVSAGLCLKEWKGSKEQPEGGEMAVDNELSGAESYGETALCKNVFHETCAIDGRSYGDNGILEGGEKGTAI